MIGSLTVDILKKRTGLVALAFARPLLPGETSTGRFRKRLRHKGWALVFGVAALTARHMGGRRPGMNSITGFSHAVILTECVAIL